VPWDLAWTICYKWSLLQKKNVENLSGERLLPVLQHDSQQPEYVNWWEFSVIVNVQTFIPCVCVSEKDNAGLLLVSVIIKSQSPSGTFR